MNSNDLIGDWINDEAADDEWIYDWATTINDAPRVEDPIEILLRESMALEPSMFEPGNGPTNPPDKLRPDMGTALQASQALATIVEDVEAEDAPASPSNRETLTCNCCTEVAGLRREMSAILHELHELRAAVHPRIETIEDLSIEFMDAARTSIALLQSDRGKAEEWMYQYQAWADTTHGVMQHLLQESEQARRSMMAAEESIE